MNATSKPRFQYIDIARGLAIICIVLGHLGNSTINRVVFTFHVPIFYLITGFFVNSIDRDVDFIKKRARSLLVPYAITSGVVTVFCSLKALFMPDVTVWQQALRWIYAAIYGAGDNYTEPFYIPAIGAIWFLLATFWGVIILHRLLKTKSVYRMIIILVIFIASVWSAKYIWLPFSLQAGGCALMLMYFGFCIRKYKDAVKDIPKEVMAVGIIFAFVVWGSFIWNFQSFWLVHCDLGRGIIDIFGSLCAIFCVFFISKLLGKYTGRFGNWIAYLGRFSIIMLCVHEAELYILPWNRAKEILSNHGFSSIMVLLVVIVIKLILDIGLTFLLSKSKTMCRLFAIKS